MGFGRMLKLEQPPNHGSRRHRNWRKLEVGKRIVDKYGVETAWELLDPPRRDPTRSLVLCVVEAICVSCGEIHVVLLNSIIQGRSQSCAKCRLGPKLARGELTLEPPYGWELDEDPRPPT